MASFSVLRRAALAVLPLLLAACANQVRFPDSATPQPRPSPYADPAAQVATGAIYRPATYRPLFEDTRARFVGDSLVISLSERTSASNSTSDNAQRTASVTAGTPSLVGTPLRMFEGVNVRASGSSKFENKDGAKADSLFTGTITVTVVEVLPNGYLRVHGEKQIGINDTVDTMRFAGIVNPATIQPGNVVPSAQVAEARLDTIGRANIDSARVAGFLGRFFLSFVPFR